MLFARAGLSQKQSAEKLGMPAGIVLRLPEPMPARSERHHGVDTDVRIPKAAREINTLQLGEYSAFVTVHWNAFDDIEQVVRDSSTSYQLLTTPDGRRFLS